MKSSLKMIRVFALGVFVLLVTGCELRQAMYNQPKLKPQGASEFFSDGRNARPLVEGTVARGHLENDDLFYKGMSNGKLADEFPFPIGTAEMKRGQERYNIYCSVCHGAAGYGDGMIVQRGFVKPTSYHDARLRSSPAGHFYNVIANGFGRMPSYREMIPTKDRWLIVAYIRALQLSQNATMNDVPPEHRSELEGGKAK